MKLIERNGLKILMPSYGYILRHKQSGNMYSGKIYLGINSSIDEYEEIRDDAIDEKLVLKLEEVDAKEESLNKIGKIVANQVTDDKVALTIQEFYDIWTMGTLYNVGQYITYKNILYKVLTEHISQENWTPDISPSLFANVLTSLDGTPQEWVQPDPTNAYMIGDKVVYEGVIYESVIDNNIWSPIAYPQGWKVVEE